MKISVITLHGVKNYGSVLQSFATKEMFESFGFDVEFINFIREDSLDKNLLDTWCGKNIIKRCAMLPTIKKWKKVFGGFLRQNLKLTDKVYTYKKDFENFHADADMYCTGSDQVWNTKWNKGVITALYLDFLPKDKYRFAYGASFGKDELESSEVEKIKDFIWRYNHISVREDYALEMLDKYYGYKKAAHIVDPSLALDGDFWREKAVKKRDNGEYILIYNLNRSKEFDVFAKELSRRTGIKLLRLCTRYDQIARVGKSIVIPEVFEFLGLIDNAKFVLTDSFHATAFALNLSTHPICVYPNEFSGRIESLLRLTETLHCHVKDFSDFDVVRKLVDFDKVNEILSVERAKLRAYLSEVFKGRNGK